MALHRPEFQQLALNIAEFLRLTWRERFPDGEDLEILKTRFTGQIADARKSLADQFFSDAAEPVLQRYFDYHLKFMTELGFQLEAAREQSPDLTPADTLFIGVLDCFDAHLFALTDDIVRISSGAGGHAQVYPAYHRHFLTSLTNQLNRVKDFLESPAPASGLKSCLAGVIQHMSCPGVLYRQQYRDLFYFEFLLNELSFVLEQAAPDPEEHILRQLLRCNFNHLEILLFFQDQIRSATAGLAADQKRTVLNERLAAVDLPAHPRPFGYDPQLPDLSLMLSHWLKEELAQTWSDPVPAPSAAVPDHRLKLFLNTSVAHLACFIKVFQEGGLSSLSTSELVRWVAANCRTKRQPVISPGSLSKEIYTVSQFTAARVREQLLKMAAGITAHYFPVVAAVYAANYIYLISG